MAARGRKLPEMQFAGLEFIRKTRTPAPIPQVQEVLQRFEIEVLPRALDIVDGGSMIRALLPNFVSESARLSRLTKRNK